MFRNFSSKLIGKDFSRKFPSTPKVLPSKIVDYNEFFRKYDVFNPSLWTKVLIHGWNNDGSSEFPQMFKNAYLRRDDYNVIGISGEKLLS